MKQVPPDFNKVHIRFSLLHIVIYGLMKIFFPPKL